MKIECLHYILELLINDFISNAEEEHIERFKKLYPNLEWKLEFRQAIKEYANNKTRKKYIIKDIYKFMELENLLGNFAD